MGSGVRLPEQVELAPGVTVPEPGDGSVLRFDEQAVQDVRDFFGLLCFGQNQWAGRPFQLLPWEEEAIRLFYGVRVQDADGRWVRYRRFAAFSAPTARVEPATAQKKRRVTKIGGVANADGKSYIVRFLHASTADPGYKLRATIVGVNTSGFSLGFLKDKETIVDLTFAAQPMDGTGTLVELDEPDDPVEGGA